MKVQLLKLMEHLVHQRKNLVLVLLKITQNFVKVCIVMLITAICLEMVKKFLRLMPKIKMLTFQLNFVSKVSLINLVPPSLENYLKMEMCMIFQSATMLS